MIQENNMNYLSCLARRGFASTVGVGFKLLLIFTLSVNICKGFSDDRVEKDWRSELGEKLPKTKCDFICCEGVPYTSANYYNDCCAKYFPGKNYEGEYDTAHINNCGSRDVQCCKYCGGAKKPTRSGQESRDQNNLFPKQLQNFLDQSRPKNKTNPKPVQGNKGEKKPLKVNKGQNKPPPKPVQGNKGENKTYPVPETTSGNKPSPSDNND